MRTEEYKYRAPKVYLYSTIRGIIENIPSEIDRWLVAVAYANGCRIGEALAVRYCDVEEQDGFLYVHSLIFKKRNAKPWRNCPIDMQDEEWLATIIWEYIKSYRKEILDDRRVWPYSRRTAQNRINKYLQCTAHSLRHNRATHLRVEFGFNMLDLKEFFGLSERGLLSWIELYGHLGKSFLTERFKQSRSYRALKAKESNTVSDKPIEDKAFYE